MKALAVVLLCAVVAHAVDLQAESGASVVEAALGVPLSAFHVPPALLETLAEGEVVNTAPVACGANPAPQVITDPKDPVTDGSGPNKDYADNLKACYTIKPPKVPAGSRVKLWFTNIEIEKNYDFIRIFDVATNAQLDDDADANTNYYSPAGFLIQFITDDSVHAGGWSANWAVEGTGNTVTTDEVTLARFPVENAKACNTGNYKNDGHFVVRRGCTWKAGIDPSAVKAAKWRFRMTDVGAPTKHEMTCPGKSAYISCTANPDGTVAFTFDVNAPVGVYDIDAVLADGKVIGGDVMAFVLFNPYNQADATYMSDASDIKAYLEANAGAVYTGDYPKAWNFGNGDMKVLRASFAALATLSEADRVHAWRVAREISWVANNNVLHGRWDGQYGDGKQPGYWPGSDVILAQWLDSGKTRVKYGQCWVFSGVVASMSRSIGIPCMSHTNMNSAHEHAPFDQKCTRFWKSSGGSNLAPDDDKNQDSVWNFHVWNAGWFARPDLKPAAPAAWNAYDGTCQEMSDGRCQMGPAYLADTKAGRLQAKYDNAFLAGETNCQIINMVWDAAAKKDVQHSVEDCTVGRNTWTFPKNGNMNSPQDVSSWYKTEPPQCKQRTSLLETGAYVSHHHETPTGATFKAIAPAKSVELGKPLTMGLQINNPTAQRFLVRLSVVKVDTRDKKLGAAPALWEFSQVVAGSKSISQTVPQAKLEGALRETNSFRLLWSATPEKASASVRDSFMHQVTVLLRPPPMRIDPAQITVGERAKVNVKWVNPINVNLKCTLKYSVADSARGFPEITKDVVSRGTFSEQIVVKTSKAGRVQGQATLSCDGLSEITGHFDVTAQKAPERRHTRERQIGKSGRFKVGPRRTQELTPGVTVHAGQRVSGRTSGTARGHSGPGARPRPQHAARFAQLIPMPATPLDAPLMVSDVESLETAVEQM